MQDLRISKELKSVRPEILQTFSQSRFQQSVGHCEALCGDASRVDDEKFEGAMVSRRCHGIGIDLPTGDSILILWNTKLLNAVGFILAGRDGKCVCPVLVSLEYYYAYYKRPSICRRGSSKVIGSMGDAWNP
jgi:hypothetical protein